MRLLLIVGLIAIAVVVLPILFFLIYLTIAKLFDKPIERSREEVIETLRAGPEGRLSGSEWDNFISIHICDPELERVRETLYTEVEVNDAWKKEHDYELGFFTTPAIRERLTQLIATLEAGAGNKPST